MEPTYLNRFSIPVVTGTPQFPSGGAKPIQKPEGSTPFQDILREKLAKAGAPNFSKHAAERVEQRQVELNESSLDRLNEGMRLAEQKGLRDTLILVDRMAFIVNVPNNTVITTVNNDELKGNVFTNIDGTVIV